MTSTVKQNNEALATLHLESSGEICSPVDLEIIKIFENIRLLLLHG